MPMTINMAPVIFLVQYSAAVTRRNRALIFFTPKAITAANKRTGRPVPMP